MGKKVSIYHLDNTIQEYDWGSRSAIPELLGRPSPAETPQAELWMGAHPKAPSRVLMGDGRKLSLPEMIRRNPSDVLGPTVAEKFGGNLPFLFKVLAAARPLSIQAHPNREQARAGFRRENEQEIPLDAFQRNYRDDNHKPEVISALTPFWALNGFRPIPEMLDLLESVGFSGIGKRIEAFRRRPTGVGLREFFATLMRLDPDSRERAVGEALAWAQRSGAPPRLGAVGRWVQRLSKAYPGDIGVLSPLLLNLVLLQPGDTMFLEAGVLHAYLEGVGIELMANSDNVIRGGLTSKHVDVDELLSILRFDGRAVRPVDPDESAPGQRIFFTPAEEFRLAEVSTSPGRPYGNPGSGSIELAIVVEGEGAIEAESSLPISRGDSLLIPAAAGPYRIQGSLCLYRAFVPL
jgi:mannose-6-phosphate isomerase